MNIIKLWSHCGECYRAGMEERLRFKGSAGSLVLCFTSASRFVLVRSREYYGDSGVPSWKPTQPRHTQKRAGFACSVETRKKKGARDVGGAKPACLCTTSRNLTAYHADQVDLALQHWAGCALLCGAAGGVIGWPPLKCGKKRGCIHVWMELPNLTWSGRE